MGTHAMCCSTEVTRRLCNLKPGPARVISHCRKTAQYRRVQASTRVQPKEVIVAPADLLLDWVANQKGALSPNVVVDRTASTAGRCLRATREQAPDDVLLSVPLSAVFADLEVCCTVIDKPFKICF